MDAARSGPPAEAADHTPKRARRCCRRADRHGELTGPGRLELGTLEAPGTEQLGYAEDLLLAVGPDPRDLLATRQEPAFHPADHEPEPALSKNSNAS